MRKTLAVLMAGGATLAGIAAASPATAATGDIQECVPAGGTMVNGVCVLPVMSVGQPAEDVLINNGGVDVWTIVSGSIPPGTKMPSTYGAGATIIAGTPTQAGTFTFTVDNSPFTGGSATPSQGTYSITVNGPLPLKVVPPAGGTTLHNGTVGTAYGFGFALSGGVGPYTWSVASGQLPPGLGLVSTDAPADNNSTLEGTPTTAGTFKFTMKVTDGAGSTATQQFTLTILKKK